LLNFDLRDALRENMLMVLSIPYLIVGVIFEMIKNPGQGILKWRKRLYGPTAIYVILTLIVGFWILRNL